AAPSAGGAAGASPGARRLERAGPRLRCRQSSRWCSVGQLAVQTTNLSMPFGEQGLQLADPMALRNQRSVRKFELLTQRPDRGLKYPNCPPDIPILRDLVRLSLDIRLGALSAISRVVEGDEYPDYAVIPDLAPPYSSPDKALGGRNRYP